MDEKWQILIIEDGQFDGTTVCLALKDYGISRKQLTVVETKEAIDTFKNNSYDFVFLNNCASNVETINLLKNLRSLKNRVPILAFVANSDEHKNKECCPVIRYRSKINRSSSTSTRKKRNYRQPETRNRSTKSKVDGGIPVKVAIFSNYISRTTNSNECDYWIFSVIIASKMRHNL